MREFPKRLIADIRTLFCVVTVGDLLLTAYCIRMDYVEALPLLSTMVGLLWTAHGTVCAFYLNMAKSDHKKGGITYEAANAAEFKQADDSENPAYDSGILSTNSPVREPRKEEKRL